MQDNIFDMIEVSFGKEKVMARPFEFEQDKNGNYIKALKAVTTCPNCGNGQHFDVAQSGVKCDNCGYGETTWHLDTSNGDYQYGIDLSESADYSCESAIVVNRDEFFIINKNQSIKTNKQALKYTDNGLIPSCPFVDPIELGTFKTDEL